MEPQQKLQADIALIGLAVMGQNLILNMNDHGFTVVAYNRTTSKVDDFLNNEPKISKEFEEIIKWNDEETKPEKNEPNLINSNITYGRLLESVNASGWSLERATVGLKWLLEKDRWKSVGNGFDDINKFLNTLQFKEFKIAVEQRKEIALMLSEINASQRATAKMLGVSAMQINRDVTKVTADKKTIKTNGVSAMQINRDVTKVTADKKTIKTNDVGEGLKIDTGANAPPDKILDEVSPLDKMGSGQNEIKNKDKKINKEYNSNQSIIEIKNTDYKNIGGVKNCNCIDYINDIPDNLIDCMITDPPYGINVQLNKYINLSNNRKIENDFDINTAMKLLDDVLSKSKSKLKENAHLYIFCTWKVYPEFKAVIEKYHTIKNVIVWNKTKMGMGDLKNNYGDSYELIIFAGGQREFIKRPSNIIECKFNDERLHNTQKPVELLEQLIENSTNVGDMIYDPFLGSGSTGVAAINKKRKIIGTEIDEQNYKITLKRLNESLIKNN